MASMDSNENIGDSVLSMLRKKTGKSNYHPLVALVDLVDHPKTKISHLINIHKTVAEYTNQKLKALEVRSEVDVNLLDFNINMIGVDGKVEPIEFVEVDDNGNELKSISVVEDSNNNALMDMRLGVLEADAVEVDIFDELD